jgi:hypothetical protein
MALMKVLIGVPCNWPTVPVQFVESLCDLRRPPVSEVRFMREPMLDIMRNKLADMAVEGGFSHLFMLDVDMLYPPDSLMSLLRDDVDVVCGLACRRTAPHVPVCLQPTDERFVFEVQVPEKRGLLKCGAVGGGGTLIKTDVFRAMEPPYFSYQHRMPNGDRVGEDLYFCQMAADVGKGVYCRTDLVYPHMITAAVAVDEDDNIGYHAIG